MKKKLIFIFLLILMIMPLNVKAASIKNASISSVVEQEIGTYFYVPINITFSGIEKNQENTSGIYMIAFSIDIDDDILEITDIYSDWFDSEIYKDDEYYYVVSIADSDSTGNKCIDQFLACSNYTANIKFHVKNTDKESTDIKITEVAAGTFKIDTTWESYTLDNMEELSLTKEIVQTIKIKKSEQEVVIEETEKNNVIQSSKPEIETNTIEKSKKSSNVTSTNDTNNNKSSNVNLKSISIENYEIEFKKEQLTYDITIDNDVKSINVSVELEDEKSTYQIVGADALKDKVEIIVTAEDGSKQTYTINIKKHEEQTDVIVKNKEEKKIDKKNNYIIVSVAGGIMLIIIIIIIFIITRHNNKKLDKMIDNI